MPAPLPVRIVDTFPFSEAYEAELLLLKLEAEAGLVEQWLIVENTYTFQGEQKGLHAAALVAADDRFAPYRERIRVVEADRVLARPVGGNGWAPGRDSETFAHEAWQRDLAMADLLALDDDTWVFCSDADELLDGQDPGRRARLGELLAGGDADGIVDLPVIRYWYDVDNRYQPILARPAVRVGHLRAGATVGQVRSERNRTLPLATDADAVGFEYSSCLPFEEVMRKLDTQAHTGFERGDLAAGLRCNRRPTVPDLLDHVRRTPFWFFERVELTPANSPALIRDQPDRLRTGTVDPAYEANRRTDHPQLYGLRGALTTAGDRLRDGVRRAKRFGRRAARRVRRSRS